jgi:hypothetical protein
VVQQWCNSDATVPPVPQQWRFTAITLALTVAIGTLRLQAGMLLELCWQASARS